MNLLTIHMSKEKQTKNLDIMIILGDRIFLEHAKSTQKKAIHLLSNNSFKVGNHLQENSRCRTPRCIDSM